MTATETNVFELHEGEASVGLAPEIGGALAWFRWLSGGTCIDWLRPADRTALAERDAAGMACFPLIPYSNRIRGGSFVFEGRAIRLPTSLSDPHFEHGHGWRRPWAVQHREGGRAVLRYRHEPDAWPWCYEAEQDIVLIDGTLTIRLTLRNLSESPMPAGFGLHPYFPGAREARIETELAGKWETDSEVLPTALVTLPSRMQTIVVAQADFDNVFTGWSRSARLVLPACGGGLHLEAETPLDFLVLYTPPGGDFFCAEPVSNATDAVNLSASGDPRTGLLVIEPGAERTACTRFTPHLTDITQT